MSRANTSQSHGGTPTAASTADLMALRDARDRHQSPPTCDHCGNLRSPKNDTCGKEACHLRHRGAKALNQIDSDHCICSTCFRVIKEVEHPPWGTDLMVEGPRGRDDESLKQDCLVGYQYQTENTVWGTDDFSNPDDPYRSLDRQRWSCVCGTVDPAERDDILEAVDLQTTIQSLHHTLRDLSNRDVIGGSYSWPRLREAIRDHGRDWELVVGYALYG